MASRRLRTGTICHVLREDVYLAEAIPVPIRTQAVEECIATVVRIPPGAWAGHRMDSLPDGIGLLVLEGLLIRHVGVSGSFGAELLGPGDLLRPWQEPDKPMLPHAVGWRVLQAVRVAVSRPTVSTALARLARCELVHAEKDGWLLSGEPPGRCSSRRVQMLSDA
jgi:hypothetical protein